MTDEQESAVHGWLALLQETDAAFVARIFHLIEHNETAHELLLAVCLDGLTEHADN